jgi:hypothetical protein
MTGIGAPHIVLVGGGGAHYDPTTAKLLHNFPADPFTVSKKIPDLQDVHLLNAGESEHTPKRVERIGFGRENFAVNDMILHNASFPDKGKKSAEFVTLL